MQVTSSKRLPSALGIRISACGSRSLRTSFLGLRVCQRVLAGGRVETELVFVQEQDLILSVLCSPGLLAAGTDTWWAKWEITFENQFGDSVRLKRDPNPPR